MPSWQETAQFSSEGECSSCGQLRATSAGDFGTVCPDGYGPRLAGSRAVSTPASRYRSCLWRREAGPSTSSPLPCLSLARFASLPACNRKNLAPRSSNQSSDAKAGLARLEAGLVRL